MHWAAESARWSYWPGRYSTAKTASPAGSARKTLSTGGSENTVFTALSKSSGAIFSTS